MQNTIFYTIFDSSFWKIILVGNEKGLCNIHLDTETGKRSFTMDTSWEHNDDFFDGPRKQILEYLAGQRKEFSIPLNPQGTPFQKKVWKALCTIPFGQVRTYKDIATAIGNPKASRAVGMANSKNPLPLIVPCHRVIGSNGKLTGFAHGLSAKQKLLDFEKSSL